MGKRRYITEQIIRKQIDKMFCCNGRMYGKILRRCLHEMIIQLAWDVFQEIVFCLTHRNGGYGDGYAVPSDNLGMMKDPNSYCFPVDWWFKYVR